MYDKKQKGKIDAKDLITVMRCLGTSPTFGEIERHLQVHKIGKVQHTVHVICLWARQDYENLLRLTGKEVKTGRVHSTVFMHMLCRTGQEVGTNAGVEVVFNCV